MKRITQSDCDLMFAKARLVLQESYRIANIERPINRFNCDRKYDALEEVLKEKHGSQFATFLTEIGLSK